MSMLRSYHVSNYGWTPLSQNSCWNAAICCSSRLYMSTNRQAFGFVQDHKIVTALFSGKTGRRWCWKTSSNIGRDKSFVYDLNTRPSIVRVRVGFVSRSAEIQLVSSDLCCQLSSSTSSPQISPLRGSRSKTWWLMAFDGGEKSLSLGSRGTVPRLSYDNLGSFQGLVNGGLPRLSEKREIHSPSQSGVKESLNAV